jgi:hypothetical protein
LDISRSEQAKIDMKWESVKARTDPLTMSDELENARVLYEGILSSKDNLIYTLRKQLEDKNNEYMNSLRAQRQDVGYFIFIIVNLCYCI